jgi:thiamine-phosphate pyrophosphorylase
VTAAGSRLYIITPETFELHPFADSLGQALDAGDVAAVQLRLKNAPDDVWKRAIDVLRPVCQSRRVEFLLNDRADLVAAAWCDGAHVGQEDMPATEARRLIGPNRTLGVTCKSSHDLADRAVQEGATYVAFGAFYPSTSKQVLNLADPDVLRRWAQRSKVPACAIGGITAANLAPIVRAGASWLAILGGVWGHPDGPAAAVRAINAAIRAAMD